MAEAGYDCREDPGSYTGIDKQIGCRSGEEPGEQVNEAAPTMYQTHREKGGETQETGRRTTWKNTGVTAGALTQLFCSKLSERTTALHN